MATTYPTTLDSFTNPNSATDNLNSVSVPHDVQHQNANDAVKALETKVGIDGSADTTTIDYKLKNTASIDPGHHHTNTSIDSVASSKITGVTFPASGLLVGTTDSQNLTNKTLTSPKINVGSDAQGDLYYRDNTGNFVRLGIGSNGQILSSNGTIPSWSNNTSSSVANIYQNGIINGGCLVSQRIAPTISTSYQYGQVDRYAAAIAGTVSAGTISQTTASSAGNSGYGIRIAGLTTTGAGTTLSIRYRMEAKDAVKFKNQSASFSCKVYQATGGAINYTITINKANAADNFSAVTQIATSGNLSVASATATTIKFENQALGDVSNGLEIIITAAIGAVTTQNLDFTEFQFNQGSTAGTFYPKTYKEELTACQRYCYAFTSTDTNSTVGIGTCGSTTLAFIYLPFKISMRTNPSITSVTASDWRVADGAAATTASSIALTAGAGHNDTVLLSVTVASGLTQFRPMQMQSTASGKSIIFDAEL